MKDGFIKDMTGFVLGIVICVTVFLPYMGIGDLKYCLIDSYHGSNLFGCHFKLPPNDVFLCCVDYSAAGSAEPPLASRI